MAQPKDKRLRIGRLRLDSRNTRIPPAHRSEDERALVHELVEHEDVVNLAASISKHGLFPNERLVVTQGLGSSFTYSWSGALSGSGSYIDGALSQSSWLYVTVSDSLSNQANDSFFITVSQDGECEF